MHDLNKPMTNSQMLFGFISVREIEGLGHCGGLLIVSQIGRPLEFHCSAPVPPNKAQQILYGKTYETFLYCEQIGLALIEKAKSKPQLLMANCGQLLSLNNLLDVPTVVLGDTENASYFQDPAAYGQLLHPTSFEIAGQTIWSPGADSQALKAARVLADSFTKTLPFEEPFERIEKAIEEAHAVAR